MSDIIVPDSKVRLSKTITENLQAIYDQGGDQTYAILSAHTEEYLTVASVEGENLTIKGYQHLGPIHRDAFVLA